MKWERRKKEVKSGCADVRVDSDLLNEREYKIRTRLLVNLGTCTLVVVDSRSDDSGSR